MDSKDLFRAMGDLEEELVRQADAPRRHAVRWPKAMAACACLAAILAGGWLYSAGRGRTLGTNATTPSSKGSEPSKQGSIAAPTKPGAVEQPLELTLAVGGFTLTGQTEGETASFSALGTSWKLSPKVPEALWALLETLLGTYVPGDVTEQPSDLTLTLSRGDEDRQLVCSGAAVLFSQEETARTLRRELREILRPLMDRTPNPQLQPMSGAAQHLTLSWENVGSCEVYLESGEVELIPRFGTKQHWALSGEEKENLLAWIDSAAWEPGEGSVELIAGETYCPAQGLDGLLLTLAIWQTAPES